MSSHLFCILSPSSKTFNLRFIKFFSNLFRLEKLNFYLRWWWNDRWCGSIVKLRRRVGSSRLVLEVGVEQVGPAPEELGVLGVHGDRRQSRWRGRGHSGWRGVPPGWNPQGTPAPHRRNCAGRKLQGHPPASPGHLGAAPHVSSHMNLAR